jgi:hypothetical protein
MNPDRILSSDAPTVLKMKKLDAPRFRESRRLKLGQVGDANVVARHQALEAAEPVQRIEHRRHPGLDPSQQLMPLEARASPVTAPSRSPASAAIASS